MRVFYCERFIQIKNGRTNLADKVFSNIILYGLVLVFVLLILAFCLFVVLDGSSNWFFIWNYSLPYELNNVVPTYKYHDNVNLMQNPMDMYERENLRRIYARLYPNYVERNPRITRFCANFNTSWSNFCHSVSTFFLELCYVDSVQNITISSSENFNDNFNECTQNRNSRGSSTDLSLPTSDID